MKELTAILSVYLEPEQVEVVIENLLTSEALQLINLIVTHDEHYEALQEITEQTVIELRKRLAAKQDYAAELEQRHHELFDQAKNTKDKARIAEITTEMQLILEDVGAETELVEQLSQQVTFAEFLMEIKTYPALWRTLLTTIIAGRATPLHQSMASVLAEVQDRLSEKAAIAPEIEAATTTLIKAENIPKDDLTLFSQAMRLTHRELVGEDVDLSAAAGAEGEITVDVTAVTHQDLDEEEKELGLLTDDSETQRVFETYQPTFTSWYDVLGMMLVDAHGGNVEARRANMTVTQNFGWALKKITIGFEKEWNDIVKRRGKGWLFIVLDYLPTLKVSELQAAFTNEINRVTLEPLSRVLALLDRVNNPEPGYQLVDPYYFEPLAQDILDGKYDDTVTPTDIINDYFAHYQDERGEDDYVADHTGNDTTDVTYQFSDQAILEELEEDVARAIDGEYVLKKVPSAKDTVGIGLAVDWAIRQLDYLIANTPDFPDLKPGDCINRSALDKLTRGGFKNMEQGIFDDWRVDADGSGKYCYEQLLLIVLYQHFEALGWRGIKGAERKKVGGALEARIG